MYAWLNEARNAYDTIQDFYLFCSYEYINKIEFCQYIASISIFLAYLHVLYNREAKTNLISTSVSMSVGCINLLVLIFLN